MITLGGPESLTRELYVRVAYDRERVALDPAAVALVDRSRALFQKHLDTGALCYGVNTGLGAQAGVDLSGEAQAMLPRHILLGRAVGTGAAFPAPVVRGAMLIKLTQFLTGYSAVSADLCRYLAERLNDGLTPYVPCEGLGMAGEITPLSHLAQTFVGEGYVLAEDGGREPAAAWLARNAVPPYQPKSKEGLSLINGAAVAPALAFDVAGRLRRALSLATLTAACSIEGLGASLEAFSADAAALRPEPGMADVAAFLRNALQGSEIARATRQPPISYRVVPQVHAAMLAALRELEEAIEEEWRSIGDNPVFIADEASPAFGRLVHSGNFHNARLTARVEAASLAAIQAAVLSERRIYRLLDQRHTGLASHLALRPGLDAGLIILHKAVLGRTARLKSLATPPSLQHADSSFGQEDFMTMIFPALDRLAEVEKILRNVTLHEMYVAAVAIDQRGGKPGTAVNAALEAVRTVIPPYAGDRSYGPELERLFQLFESGGLPVPELR